MTVEYMTGKEWNVQRGCWLLLSIPSIASRLSLEVLTKTAIQAPFIPAQAAMASLRLPKVRHVVGRRPYGTLEYL